MQFTRIWAGMQMVEIGLNAGWVQVVSLFYLG